MTTTQADGIFSGGGIKGLAFAGAIQAAEEAGYTEWGSLAGTSAGAICALAMALGYDAAGLKQLFSYDFSKLDDEILGFIPNYFGHAITKGNGLTAFIASILANAPLKTSSFEVFGELPDGKLQVISTDITRQRMIVFPRDAALYIDPLTDKPYKPSMFPLALAVRISAGYPGFFPPVLLKDAASGQDSALVDGGVTSGFPIFLFDTPKPTRPTWGFELYDGPPNNPISGLLWPIGMINAIINTGINSLDTFELETFGNRIVAIPTGSVSALNFSLTDVQRKELYDSGYQTTKKFFAAIPDPTNRFGATPSV
jgi:NTE family protein